MADSLVTATLAYAWKTLTELGVPAAVMGGIAASRWRHVGATQDVALLVEVEKLSPDELFAAFQKTGCRPRHVPAIVSLNGGRFLQLAYEKPGSDLAAPIDLLLAESDFHRSALAHRGVHRFSEISTPVSFLSCEDLILLKLLSAEVLDQSDVGALLSLNAVQIDW